MTAELWAIPALLLVVLVIGLVALMRGRSRPPPEHRPSTQAPQRSGRSGRPTAAPAPAHQPFEPSVDGDLDTEPDNLHTRREAAAEALKIARQRAAQDAARLDARRQLRSRLPEPPAAPTAAAPIAPASPAAAPARVTRAPAGLDLPLPLQAPATPPTPRPTPMTAAQAQPLAPPVSSPVAPPNAPPFAPPFAPSRAAALTPAVTPHAPVAPTQPYPAQVRMPAPSRPFTILVVDDSKVVRIKTSRLLEKHHYQVVLADDGLTALTALSQQWPDLLITDVEMPGLDGFGLTQRLRGMPGGTALPVIMITSSNDRHRDAATQAGVNVLLGKPYPEDQLLAEVEAALAGVAQPAPAGAVMQ